MSNSLSEDLREGYRQVADDLPQQAVALLAGARDSVNAGPAERNRCLAAIVAAYRCSPRQLWAPVLLDLLAPAIIERLQRLCAEPPALDEEELRQQFVVEVLQAAAYIPLPDRPAWQKKQILSRANQAVRRWLEREGRRQDSQRSFEGIEEERW
jgi:hypothetical protein